MVRVQSCVVAVLCGSAVAVAGDLVVDSGEFVIAQGETYANVTVIYPGRVVMTGGTVTGGVSLVGPAATQRGEWTMTAGVVMGDVDLDGGNFNVLGGRVEGAIEGRYETRGGAVVVRDAEVLGRIYFDLVPASVIVERSTISEIDLFGTGSFSVSESHVTGGLFAGSYEALSASGSVTDSVVDGVVRGSAGSQLTALRCTIGGAFKATVRECVVNGDILASPAFDSTIFGNAGDGEVGGEDSGSRLTNCKLFGNFASGSLFAPGWALGSEVFGNFVLEYASGAPSNSIVHGFTYVGSCQFGADVENSEFIGNLIYDYLCDGELKNIFLHSGLEAYDSSLRIPVYRLVIDGVPIALQLGQANAYIISGDASVEIEVITPNGTRNAFSLESSSSTVRFIGRPLENTGCSPADIAPPRGVLDLSDTVSFIRLFELGDVVADLAPPAGVFDMEDITAFVEGFLAGCP